MVFHGSLVCGLASRKALAENNLVKMVMLIR